MSISVALQPVVTMGTAQKVVEQEFTAINTSHALQPLISVGGSQTVIPSIAPSR